MCEQDEIWQEPRYFSEARMNELYDDGRTRRIDGPVEWARLEAEARKMLESGLELADRVETTWDINRIPDSRTPVRLASDQTLNQLSRHYLPLHDSLLLMFRKRGPLQFWGAVHARSAPMVSRGKTYRYQKFLCTTGSQICQAGLRYTLICPAWHRLCVRAPTPRFRAVTPTYGGIYHRASHAALPGFPAPPHNRLRAPQSCRHCQPCACDER